MNLSIKIDKKISLTAGGGLICLKDEFIRPSVFCFVFGAIAKNEDAALVFNLNISFILVNNTS